jgi:hypothetical protein
MLYVFKRVLQIQKLLVLSGSMRKDDLSTDTTFDPCWFSLDYTFNFSS